MTSTLALINARGGSKGIPGKNKKLLASYPLIAWSIIPALRSSNIDSLVVSTDDHEIAQIARSFGAQVPFIRPQHLSTDTSLQIDAIKHCVDYFESINQFFDNIILLQPTVPLRSTFDIDNSIEHFLSSDSDSLISVCDVGGRHPKTLYQKSTVSDNLIIPIQSSSNRGVLRQSFQPIFWRNGAIYLFKSSVLNSFDSLYGSSISYYNMPEERSFNLDSMFDWNLCQSYITYNDIALL